MEYSIPATRVVLVNNNIWGEMDAGLFAHTSPIVHQYYVLADCCGVQAVKLPLCSSF